MKKPIVKESPDARMARVLDEKNRRDMERRKATLGLYALKTKESNYGLPYCAVNDHFALLASKQILPLADVYKIGSVCLLDGRIVAERKPVLVLDK